MKIVICGSMSSAQKMLEIKNKLYELGHVVILPKHTEKYASGEIRLEDSAESTKNKIEQDLIRDYFHEIDRAEAVLVVNVDKRGIKNYIGGNAFLEMGFAHALDKKIFILNDVPDMIYTDEIIAMQPIVLKENLSVIS
jgi:nucleoside 2-deoxyribosyltransferase